MKNDPAGVAEVPPRWAPLQQSNRQPSNVAVVRPTAQRQQEPPSLVEPVKPDRRQPVKPPDRTTSIPPVEKFDGVTPSNIPSRQLWKTPSNPQYYVDPKPNFEEHYEKTVYHEKQAGHYEKQKDPGKQKTKAKSKGQPTYYQDQLPLEPPNPLRDLTSRNSKTAHQRKFGIMNPNDDTIHRHKLAKAPPEQKPISPGSVRGASGGAMDFHCNPQEYSDVIKNMQRKVLGYTSQAETQQQQALRAASMNMGYGKRPSIKKSGSMGTGLTAVEPVDMESKKLHKPAFDRCNSSSGSSSSDSMSKEDVQSHLLDFVNRNSGRLQPGQAMHAIKESQLSKEPDKSKSKRRTKSDQTAHTLPRSGHSDGSMTRRGTHHRDTSSSMNTTSGTTSSSSNENLRPSIKTNKQAKPPPNYNETAGSNPSRKQPPTAQPPTAANVKNLICSFNRGLTTTSFSSGGGSDGPKNPTLPKHSTMHSMSSTSSSFNSNQIITNTPPQTANNLPSSKQSSIASSSVHSGPLTLATPHHHSRSGSTPMRLSTKSPTAGSKPLPSKPGVSSMSQSSLLETDVFIDSSVVSAKSENSRSLGVLREHLMKEQTTVDPLVYHRRKTSSMKRNEYNKNRNPGPTSSMPRSASVSNFRSKQAGEKDIRPKVLKPSNESSSSSNSLNSASPNPLRVASMPKLNRTDSLPGRHRNKVNFEQQQQQQQQHDHVPPEAGEHANLSGAITALPANSSYYNISASRARLLDGTPPTSPPDTTKQLKISKLLPIDRNNSKSSDSSKILEAVPSALTTRVPCTIDSSGGDSGSSSTIDENEKLKSLSATIKESMLNADHLSAAAARYESESARKLGLIKKIRKRCDELLIFRDEIEDEIQENNEIGETVKVIIHECGTERDVERFTLVVRDLEPTIGLIFGLSGRLKRCERVLETVSSRAETPSQEETQLLLEKRDQLETQLHEAQKIKARVEQRRDDLAERLRELLSPEDFDSFEGFLRQKVQLFQQAVELEDKIKLGDEQLSALKQSMSDTDD